MRLKMLISKIRQVALACSLAGFALLASAQDSIHPLPVQEFLLASSAGDFAAHEQTRLAKVRNVHLRYAENGDEKMYMLCGQFQPASPADEPVWIDFATVKTEGYEVWLGAQATALCNNASGALQDTEDLSAELQARLETASAVE